MLGDMRLALILHRIGTPAGIDTEKEWLDPLRCAADGDGSARVNSRAHRHRTDSARLSR
jgi:hypothetical protein